MKAMGSKPVMPAITGSSRKVTADIQLLQFTIANACMADLHIGKLWMLVDTGLEDSAGFIIKAAEKRYGAGTRPQAIILTHGHFDHAGSLVTLTKYWDIPAYIHEAELPCITGRQDYPGADVSIGGGPIFPHAAVDIGHYAVALPENGAIPGAPDWRWVPTPGHTQGHISLFREKDGVLIAGDALSCVRQDSLLSILFQHEISNGPPAWMTGDWDAAGSSVNFIYNLHPALVIPGHGSPMKGKDLSRHLQLLTAHFNEISAPDYDLYLHQ